MKLIGLPKIKNAHSIHIDQNVSKDALVFDCESAAYPSVYNVWFKDTKEISGSTNNRALNITGHLIDNSGLYQCIAYNDIGASMKLIFLTLGVTGILFTIEDQNQFLFYNYSLCKFSIIFNT